MKEVNIVFRTLWHERSVSVDESYKQWVKKGFDWCHDLMCNDGEKNRIIKRINEDYSKLSERYSEVTEISQKRYSNILNLEKKLEEAIELVQEANDLFEDIYKGEYEVDSFTSQPYRIFLDNILDKNKNS